MRSAAVSAMLAGLLTGVGITLGRRRQVRTPRTRSAWPDLAGEFAL